jgi:hypothetical protein
MSDADLEHLHAMIVAAVPELDGLPWRALTEGWDSVAIDVGDISIFKFAREAQAGRALQREAQVLAALKGNIAMRIPEMTVHAGPPVFSSHPKIPGRHLLARDYEALDEAARQRLGRELGRFHADLHRMDVHRMAAAGAAKLPSLGPVEHIRRRAWPLLPEELKPDANAVLDAFQALSPDPCGVVFGFFDGHGWNMAFDHQAGRLNGIYDFGDSGLAPLHQEFVYSSFISPDLTARIIAAYEVESGRRIDRLRVDVLTGTHRLWELAEAAETPAHVAMMLENVRQWHLHRLRGR